MYERKAPHKVPLIGVEYEISVENRIRATEVLKSASESVRGEHNP